ncbi:_F30 [Hirschfeldia incana]|nr:>F30 [Hirschfeldia incana]
MTADVSSLVRLLSRYNDNRTTVNDSAGQGSLATLMTRDFLGSGSCRGGGCDQSLELDLDLEVPNGWEKRLDLKSGKMYLQQRNSTPSSPHRRAEQSNQTFQRFQNLNVPSKSSARPLLSLFEDTSLELKLVPSSSSPASSSSSSLCLSSTSSSFQSVCTLDKVKSALERAGKVSSGTLKKRKSPEEEDVCDQTASAAASCPVAVGCPGCLSYVLVMKNNPKCPRCHTVVALPTVKRPKIDLNISV